MIDRLDRLSLAEGDLLLVHIDRREITQEEQRSIMARAGDALTTLGLSRVQVIICLGGIDLKKMPEREMARHGWVRAPATEE